MLMAEPAPKNRSQAVEVVAGPRACAAARELEGQRFLTREAPLLPLPECTALHSCACKYRKWDDRRQDSRRLVAGGISSQFYAAEDRRAKKPDRRRSD